MSPNQLRPAGILRRIADALDAAGVRDDGEAALAATAALVEHGAVDVDVAASALPDRFLGARGAERDQVRGVLERALRDVALQVDHPLLVPIDELDSFSSVASLSRRAVADLRYPLDIAEDDVKAALHKILGEPFETPHSPAELSDIHTSHAVLSGRRVRAAFMLKGPGLGKPVMQIKDLGRQGNQVVKLSRSEAQLLVVQFVGQIAEDVVAHLRHAVAAGRADGADVTGSVWDGADTARLLVSRGWLDSTTGSYRGPTAT